MKNRILAYCTTGAILALGIAGCKSDGIDYNDTGDIGMGGSSSDIVYAKQDDGSTLSAAEAYNEGDGLSAKDQSTAEVLADYDEGTVTESGPATFAITRNGDGGVDVTVDGTTQHFTEADLDAGANPSGAHKGGDGEPYYGAFSTFNTLEEVDQGTGRTKYANVWGYNYAGPGDNQQRNGYAAVGTETRPADVKAQPKASYEGGFFVEAYAAEASDSEPTGSRTQLYGDVHLDADFDNANISGSVDNLFARDRLPGDGDSKPDYAARSGTIIMEDADISGNGYSGALSADADAKADFEVDNIDGSTYAGKFYGPDAEETAGVVNLHVNNDDGSTNVGVGGFSANKANP